MGLVFNLARENLSEVGLTDLFSSTKLLLEAAEAHDSDDWEKVDNRSKEYYELVI